MIPGMIMAIISILLCFNQIIIIKRCMDHGDDDKDVIGESEEEN